MGDEQNTNADIFYDCFQTFGLAAFLGGRVEIEVTVIVGD